jgi:hypothetical protein
MYQAPVKNKNKGPMYTVEVFTKKGTDVQECKDHILETTGTVPGIYDKGTHYVTHMRDIPNQKGLFRSLSKSKCRPVVSALTRFFRSLNVTYLVMLARHKDN